MHNLKVVLLVCRENFHSQWDVIYVGLFVSFLPTKETKHKLEECCLCVIVINCWYREQVLIFIYKFNSPELDSPSMPTPIKI